MSLLETLAKQSKEDKRKIVSFSLKCSTIADIETMAKQAGVNKSFLVQEFLTAAILLEKSIGLKNYVKGYEKVNLEPTKRKTTRGKK